MLHAEPFPVGRFGAWNRGGTHAWELPLQKRLSCKERAALEERRGKAKAALAAEIAQRQAKARAVASYIWERAATAPEGHPYLEKKQIKPNGAKLYRGSLVLPLRDVEGCLHSLQFISPDGDKVYLRGGRVSGCCYGLGSVGRRIYVSEGFATGATVYEVTGDAVAIAFSANNLTSVATTLRQKHPEVELVVAADNDQWTKGNPGQAKALDAAVAAAAKRVLPSFQNISTRPTDFNDLCRLHGPEEVRKQLQPMRANTLLEALVIFIRRFVIMSEAQAIVVALWVLHTFVFRAADSTPYLNVSSPEKRSGKSRLLEVLEILVAAAWYTGRVTAAVLIRKIDAEAPSLLLDESDAAFAGDKEYAEALRGVLNTGHR